MFWLSTLSLLTMWHTSLQILLNVPSFKNIFTLIEGEETAFLNWINSQYLRGREGGGEVEPKLELETILKFPLFFDASPILFYPCRTCFSGDKIWGQKEEHPFQSYIKAEPCSIEKYPVYHIQQPSHPG